MPHMAVQRTKHVALSGNSRRDDQIIIRVGDNGRDFSGQLDLFGRVAERGDEGVDFFIG